MLFAGGFPRTGAPVARAAAQRAIYFVQRELEEIAAADAPAIILCDRGTVDGLAYWPGPGDFWQSVGTTREQEFGRYDMVIHLRTPAAAGGYNQQNPLRTESAIEAAAIDRRIEDAWAGHPHRVIVNNSSDFLEKASRAVDLIHDELPDCCRHHPAATSRVRAAVAANH